MAMKIALIVAVVCFAQGFAQGPATGIQDNFLPCKPVAEEIPREFEDAINQMDELRESVGIAVTEAYAKGADIGVLIACFREQKGAYVALGQRVAGMIRKAANEMAQDLGDKYEKYGKRVEVPLRNIAVTMKTLPGKMWALIKDQEFAKALELMKESRRIVRENAEELAKIMGELRAELPEFAEKAGKMIREIRMEARKGSEAIAVAFRKCVEAGGPNKKPIEGAEEVQEN